jgi:hypothetical protein
MGIFFFFFHPSNQRRKESNPELDPEPDSKPDPLVRSTDPGDPDPHQNVTDPQHWLIFFLFIYPIYEFLWKIKNYL